MRTYLNDVASAVIMHVEEEYQNVEGYSQLTTSVLQLPQYIEAEKGFTMVVPQLIIDFLLWSPNITSVGLEDDNEIVMQIEPWTAAEKAKETRDQDTFGFVRAPAGSNVPDAEIQEATRAALRGVGYKMTKFHATFNEYGFRKPDMAFHFEMPESTTSPEQVGMTPLGPPVHDLFRLKENPPVTESGVPLNVEFSKRFCNRFFLCSACLKRRDGGCVCNNENFYPRSTVKRTDAAQKLASRLAKQRRQ